MLKHLQTKAKVSLKGATFSAYLMGAWVNSTFVLPRRSESRVIFAFARSRQICRAVLSHFEATHGVQSVPGTVLSDSPGDRVTAKPSSSFIVCRLRCRSDADPRRRRPRVELVPRHKLVVLPKTTWEGSFPFVASLECPEKHQTEVRESRLFGRREMCSA